MDREKRPDTGEPTSPPRHLDLAWSCPAQPWDVDSALAAPEGATVPATAWAEPWAEPWPRIVPNEPEADPEPEGAEDESEPTDPPTAPTAGYYVEGDYDDLVELDEVSFPKQRLPRSTWFLAAAVLLVLAFGAGILTQKHHDAGLVDPKASALAQLKDAAAGGGAGAGPVLTGTVVSTSPTEITVRDAQGKDHKVAVTDQTPIVKKLTPQGLSSGSQVAVQGTSDADGTLHAIAVMAP